MRDANRRVTNEKRVDQGGLTHLECQQCQLDTGMEWCYQSPCSEPPLPPSQELSSQKWLKGGGGWTKSESCEELVQNIPVQSSPKAYHRQRSCEWFTSGGLGL